MPDNDQQQILLQLRRAAMNSLARREHGRAELAQKLAKRAPENQQLIPECLDQLERDGLLSDSRFAEAYIHNRAMNLYGVDRIKQELVHKGVDSNVIAEALLACNVNWFDVLDKVWQKKYQQHQLETPEEKYKAMAYLHRRGFDEYAIRQLISMD